jgi:hypothetical protein
VHRYNLSEKAHNLGDDHGYLVRRTWLYALLFWASLCTAQPASQPSTEATSNPASNPVSLSITTPTSSPTSPPATLAVILPTSQALSLPPRHDKRPVILGYTALGGVTLGLISAGLGLSAALQSREADGVNPVIVESKSDRAKIYGHISEGLFLTAGVALVLKRPQKKSEAPQK